MLLRLHLYFVICFDAWFVCLVFAYLVISFRLRLLGLFIFCALGTCGFGVLCWLLFVGLGLVDTEFCLVIVCFVLNALICLLV